MSTDEVGDYAEWRSKRIRHIEVADIKITLRVATPGILNSCGSDLLKLVDDINEMDRRDKELIALDLVDSPTDLSTSRDFSLPMRKALDIVLPQVLVSPNWLKQALDDFSDDEIIESYNAVMHGTGTNADPPIPPIPF